MKISDALMNLTERFSFFPYGGDGDLSIKDLITNHKKKLALLGLEANNKKINFLSSLGRTKKWHK